VICQNCFQENEKGSNFCIHCGSKLNKMIISSVSLIAYMATLNNNIIYENKKKIISNIFDYLAQNNTVNFRNKLDNIFNKAIHSLDKDYYFMMKVYFYEFKNYTSSIDQQKHAFHLMVEFLIEMIYADGIKNEKVRIAVEEIARYFDVPQSYLQTIYNKFENTQDNRQKTSDSSNKNTLDKYYSILKSTQNSTNMDIKRAYRELVRQYHPDSIQGKELPEDFMLFANERLKEINNAYDIIKKERGIK